MAATFSSLLRDIREKGLENTFQRYYSAYQASVKSIADEEQRGLTSVHYKSLGFPEDHPDFVDIISPFASDDAGFFFPPYKDDVVFVSFDHGDINAPRVVGSFWKTSGDHKPSESSLPQEFVKTEKNAEGKEVGVAPTVRGIKVKVGSALAFDETEDNVSVEVWTGTSQGIGKRATKLHRLRLDSTTDAGQAVLATYGDENSNAEAASDDDSTSDRERKELEGRLRHQILMRDTTDDRFVQIKTIGEDDDQKFHEFIMSDTERVIRAQSWNEHFFEIDDENDISTWSVKDGFRWVIDQAGKLMFGETPAGRRITLDDDTTNVTIETPSGQTFKFDNDETLLEDTRHDINVKGTKDINIESTEDTKVTTTGAFNVEATADSTHDYTADLEFSVGNDWTSRITNALKLLVTGEVTIEGAKVVITSGTVEIGTGNLQKLMNKIAMDAINTHTHTYLAPVHPAASVPTSPPLVPLIEGTHTTVATTAA